MIDGINQLPAQTYFYQKDIKLGWQMYFFFHITQILAI